MRQNGTKNKLNFKKIIFEIFLLVIFLILSIFIIKANFGLLKSFMAEHKILTQSFFYFYLFAALGHFIILVQIFILLFILAIKLSKRSFKEIGIFWGQHTLINFISGIAIAFLVVGCIWVVYFYTYKPVYQLKVQGLYQLLEFFPFLVFAFLLEAVYEEIIFRSWLLIVLREIFGTKITIIFGGLIFGVVHLLNPHYSLNGAISMILYGMLLSYIFFKTGSIWMPVAFHAAWNFAIEMINSPYIFRITLSHGGVIHHVSDMEATPGAIIFLIILWLVIIFFSQKGFLLKTEEEN